MFGKRCESCGEVRWSILGRSEEAVTDCPACGARMVEERRHPGSRARRITSERRDRPETLQPLSSR